MLGLLGLGLGLMAAAGEPAPAQPRGLPFIRTYPLDEIGAVPRGLRLGFDAFGRVAVMYDGIYSVLNDTAWVDRIDQAQGSKVRMTTIKVAGGRYYYGGRGSWGTVELAADGTFRAAPLVPADAPAWTRVTPFNKLIPTSRGMYFYEFNGAVFWDFTRRVNVFFEVPRLTAAFAVGDRVFASCQDHRIHELLPDTGTTRPVTVPGLEEQTVEYAVPLDATRALLALYDGRLFTFDGQQATPWIPRTGGPLPGKISSMEPLTDGGVALAYDDQGVFLFSPEGELRWSLAIPEFRRIRNMAAGEPGVLWAAGENAVHRIYYDSPLTSFGQPAGLKASWPHLVEWRGRLVACSSRLLYEAESTGPGRLPAFRVLAGDGTLHIDCLAARGPHLLAGTPDGVSALAPDGRLTPLIRLANVAGLAFLGPDLCVAFGNREIAALRYADGRWEECTPRIEGVGDAPIRLEEYGRIWIEMGGDRVAHLTLRDGRLELRRVTLPWSGEQWTNVGRIGATIVLTGSSGQRAFYDEARDALTAAPALEKLLARSPYWLLRMKEDGAGVIWATHAQGVVTFTPAGADYVMDAATYELRNDSYPKVIMLPGDQPWIATGWSLYHVERQAPRSHRQPRTVLVSLVADRHDVELLDVAGLPARPPELSYDDNSLSFRFFSGTYAWRFPPQYEYRLGSTEAWTPIDPSMVLRFPKLRDGAYLLEVRQAGPHAGTAPPFSFAFTIRPPWYRTPASYAAYATGLLLALLGLARWMNLRSLRHNAELSELVHERTKDLKAAMIQLSEKSRNEATLAERSRLAGEIHDSMQQGLSGSLLHLETTMNHPSVTPEVRQKLNVVRNMLAYSREEVQQAVWNLESPLLQNATLDDALRKIAGYISSGTMEIEVVGQGDPADLPPATRHHLLRIAQEAITNAAKHARAAHIRVILENARGAVSLTVTDDGRGFDPAQAAHAEGHFGLRGLRSRVRAIKADLQITSAPGAGTTVRVTVSPPSVP